MESPRLKGTTRHSPSNLSLLGEEAAGRVLAAYVLAVNASSGTEKADPGVQRLNRGHFGRHYMVLWRCESCPSVRVAFTGDKAEMAMVTSSVIVARGFGSPIIVLDGTSTLTRFANQYFFHSAIENLLQVCPAMLA